MSRKDRASEAEPLAVSTVLVPMSTSGMTASALTPAMEIAGRFGAEVRALIVTTEQAEVDTMAERVAELAPSGEVKVDTWVGLDVTGSILAAAREYPFTLLCMASHGRGRLGEVILGSFTTALLSEATDPVLLVGPSYESSRRVLDGPVFACVDGSEPSESAIPEAGRWASALGVPLRIVTVAEPALAGLDGRPPHRLYGPDEDPRSYVDRLADTWRRTDVDTAGVAIFDPLGPGPALASELETAPCGLLAVTTHARTGLRRAVFGSQAAGIVRHSPVPVLVLPPAAR